MLLLRLLLRVGMHDGPVARRGLLRLGDGINFSPARSTRSRYPAPAVLLPVHVATTAFLASLGGKLRFIWS